MTNTFAGPDALKDFLDPAKHANLPMVELPQALNPFAKDKVRVFAKLMGLSPLGNVKAFPAFNMVREMSNRGDLEGVERLVENSSGNTVFSMAVAARQFGVERTQAYVSSRIPLQKLLMLQFYGVEPIVSIEPKAPSSSDKTTGVYMARMDGKQANATNPGQYENEDNPAAHEKWTGPQIWEQTEGKIDIFCAGLGTAGTIIGNSKFLKNQERPVKVVGTIPAPDQYAPGVRTEKLLNVVDFDWRAHVDVVETVNTEESYISSIEMCRLGILAGPSAGLALVGLIKHLTALRDSDQLDAMRDSQTGEIICVFICPDGPVPYLDEYFQFVDASHFPPITNEELLVNKP